MYTSNGGIDMKLNPHRWNVAARHICVLVVLLLIVDKQKLAAQTVPQLGTQMSKEAFHIKIVNASLPDVLAEIHNRTALNFAVDGVPAKTGIMIDVSGTADLVLDSLSQSFGYSWTRSKTGVILLRKNFTDPNDVPQLNLLEWQRSAQDVDRILSGFPGPFDSNQLVALANQFYTSLTPEQKLDLSNRRAKDSMQYSNTQLSPLLQLCIAAKLSHPQQLWRAFNLLLTALPASSLQIETSRISKDGDESVVELSALNLYISGPSGNRGSLTLFRDTVKRQQTDRAGQEDKKK